ncbi:MAG: FosX/FosE/FosI family fosfomycin resistance thiol transferase, partial [Alphaproteobacteria bacterium]
LIVEVLGGTEVYASGAETFSIAREKFFLANGVWIAIMEGEPLAQRTYNHIAFKVGAGELERCRAALARLGLEVRESRPRDEGEGQSLYFYDDDNHLFELHSGTLDERLRRYAQGKIAPAPA